MLAGRREPLCVAELGRRAPEHGREESEEALVNVTPISGAALAPPAIRLIRTLAWLCIGVIAVLSLLPGDERPHTGWPGQVEHFSAYAGTGFLLGIGFFDSWPMRLRMWSGLAAASLGFEGLQNFVPGRSPSLIDAAASTLGLSFGFAVATLMFPVVAKLLGHALRRAGPYRR
jgi:VanZ family protein